MLVRASLYLEAKQKLYPIITQLRAKERGSREFLGETDESGSMPETPLFFISNRRPISQAGRRGFDPRLPLLESASYSRAKDVVLQNTPLRDLECSFELIDRFPPPSQFWNRIYVLIHTKRVGHDGCAPGHLESVQCRFGPHHGAGTV